jgi:site-specific DNA recombinase
MEKANQAIIYTRFSPRPNAAECESNEKQASRCVAYCNKNDYEIVGAYDDRAVSGATPWHLRHGLSTAIGCISPGTVLIVDRNDRLARDMLVALTIHREVEDRGGTIEFADGSPLRATPEGKLFQNILSAFANFEREKFAERTKAGMAKKKASGVHCGRPPYGYRISAADDGKKLVEDVMEQSTISCIRDMHIHGYNSERIAYELRGYLHSQAGLCRGKPWSARTIRRIISRFAK